MSVQHFKVFFGEDDPWSAIASEPPTQEERRSLVEAGFAGFIGNERAIKKLKASAFDALGKPDHLCRDLAFSIFGPASSGKTTLARLFARTVELPFVEISPKAVNATEAEDNGLAEEMLHDEKERAEHVMLVDLGRNDVGRVSRFGSVKVDKLMFVERYSHVMHIVSAIEGRLRPELTAVDALRACFPAGTLSGAPKVRAMEIIEELEPARRGTYGGAVLYADFSGNLDSCIAIRSMLAVGGKGSVQAGAGIVADSVPELEHQESLNKAQAVIRAIERARQM